MRFDASGWKGTMKCIECGYQNEPGTKYCVNCGQSLEDLPIEGLSSGDAGRPAVQNDKPTPERSIHKQARMHGAFVIAAVALIGAALAGTIIVTGVFNKTPLNAQESPDGSTSITGSVAFEDDDSDDEPLADESPSLDDVEVRSQLSDYSWDELAKIATQLESCDQEGEALKIAQNYKLVESSGSFPRSTKEIATLDGKVLHMRLVGVWHDIADTASGKAGLSFLCDGIITRHAMGDATTVPGGWKSSAMRYWLNNDYLHTMPSEVSDHIVPVRKKTNNEGATRTVSSVTETLDSLWLPSIVELCGPVNWVFESNSENSDIYNAVFNAEGTQYAAFAQETIDDFAGNQIFSLGGEWWLRSIAPAGGKGRYVDGSGDPSYYGDANELRGIVLGFCL